jgi:L-2-hydroxyglutarate oxidase LhgO
MLEFPQRYDLAIIGGGIVGLATAFEITQRYPGISVTILEKEHEIAYHQTGHNSGVIHSGVYYKPGSVKARTCTRGAALLRKFCNENGVPYYECGKIIIARHETEVPRLKQLYDRGATPCSPLPM